MTKAWRIAVAVTVAVVAAGVAWMIAEAVGPIADPEAKVTMWAAEDSDGLRPVVLDFINNTKSNTLDIAVAWLGDPQIEQALKDAQERGIRVRIIMQDHEANADECRAYKDDVGPVFNMGQLHHKFAVAGNRVLTGSLNWTDDSIGDPNDVVLIESEVIASAYDVRFVELLGDEKTDPGCPD